MRQTEVATEERGRVAHLLRRTGFGATAAEIDAALDRGYVATVDRLIDGADAGADAVPAPKLTRPPFPVRADEWHKEADALTLWWLRRMICSTNPLREKLTLFWHGYFPTSLERVHWPAAMLDQNEMFRDLATAHFDTLAQAVTTDLAMLLCTGGLHSDVTAPDPHLAHALLERFTLGPGRFTQTDVEETARALTGWVIDRGTGHVRFDAARFDAGQKRVLGHVGYLHAADVVHAAVEHPACAPHVASRLWSALAYPIRATDRLAQELGDRFVDADYELGELLFDILVHPQFQSSYARSALVKTPLEWTLSVHRALAITPRPATVRMLERLDHVPFRPPGIAGWPTGPDWLQRWPARARLQLVSDVVAEADLRWIADVMPWRRPQLLATALGLPGWSTATTRALDSVSGDAFRVTALAVSAPEFMLA
jgi:uncharacterized protein (DUF1800 family)